MSNYKSAEKIRVLHVITRLERGGAPAVLLEVLQRCDNGQFEHHIATGYAPEPEKDMIAFARGIIQLLKDNSLALQMAECGYQRLKACFDIRETVSKTEHLYKELLEK